MNDCRCLDCAFHLNRDIYPLTIIERMCYFGQKGSSKGTVRRLIELWKVDKGSHNGVTTESYVNALDWRVDELGAKTILLKNTHASLSLKYRLLGFAFKNGIGTELVLETTLEAGEIAEFHYDRQWDRLVMQVVNGTGEADYQVDYEGQGA